MEGVKGCRGRCNGGVRIDMRCTLYNDRMGGEFREGKRGKKGVCCGGGLMALFLQRTHKEK